MSWEFSPLEGEAAQEAVTFHIHSTIVRRALLLVPRLTSVSDLGYKSSHHQFYASVVLSNPQRRKLHQEIPFPMYSQTCLSSKGAVFLSVSLPWASPHSQIFYIDFFSLPLHSHCSATAVLTRDSSRSWGVNICF